MGLFEHFPYTNFHELNIDWWLRAMKELDDRVTALEKRIEEIKQEILNEVDQKLKEFKEELLQEVQQKLDELKAEIEQLLNERLEALEIKLTNMINAVESKVDKLQADFDKCCAEVEAEIDAINGLIDSINGDIDAINTEINNIKTSIDQVNARIDGIDTRLSMVESDITNILDSIGNINDSIGTINNKITNLTTRVTSLETAISSLDATVQNHETRITALENAGGGGGGEALIFSDPITTTVQLDAFIKESKKHYYAGIGITLAAQFMSKGSYDLRDFVKKQPEGSVPNLNCITFYINDESRPALTANRNWVHCIGTNLNNALFKYINAKFDAGTYAMSCEFTRCVIEVTQAGGTAFVGCTFNTCTINCSAIAVGDMEETFNGCVFIRCNITSDKSAARVPFTNCTFIGNRDKYKSGSPDMTINAGYLASCQMMFTKLVNTTGALIEALQENTFSDGCNIVYLGYTATKEGTAVVQTVQLQTQ